MRIVLLYETIMGKVFSSLGVLLLFSCFGICGCESVSGMFRHKQTVDSTVVATWWDGPRIRPGVALIIQVGTIAAPPTVLEALVDQKGEITLPLLLQKPVACDGLTLEELKDRLTKAYSEYYRQPMITVTFAPYDGKGVSPWGTVMVVGEVGRPGPVDMPATQELSVMKAIMLAGGANSVADKRRVQVTRCLEDGTKQKKRVDLIAIGEDGDPKGDILLKAGDVVYVPMAWY